MALMRYARLLAFVLGIAVAGSAWGEYFVYKASDGTIWYTDRKLPRDRYTLLAKIARPQARATVACRNITPKSMERRARQYLPDIKRYGQFYNIDYRLIKAVITVESCFDSGAVSRAGAQGLMQLMPFTAIEMGVKDVFNATQNIRGGTRYLRLMLDRFGQNKELALAAYNAGPHAVEKYDRSIPPYKETQKYVRRVLKNYQHYVAMDTLAAATNR